MFFKSSYLAPSFVLALACSDPTYNQPPDAGEPLPSAQRDAQPSPLADANTPAAMNTPDAANSSPVDAGACTDCGSFASGQYVVVARFYGSAAASGGGWFSEESIALVDVQSVSGQPRMRWRTCAYRGQIVVPVFPTISYAVSSPESFPERTFDLTVSGDSFQASAPASLIGYETVTGCAAGTSQSHAERAWLFAGQCSCPNSELPPTLPGDCRVIDADNDGNPGFTVVFSGGTENASYTRIRESSQIVNGRLSPDGRHVAQLLSITDTFQLSCQREPCSRSSAQVCPAERNPVRFLPLAAKDLDWDCAGAVAAAENSGLIGLGVPTAPDC